MKGMSILTRVPAMSALLMVACACASTNSGQHQGQPSEHHAQHQARHQSSGVFSFTIKACGKLTPSQQQQYQTSAPYGAIVSVTNQSTKTLSVSVNVAFKVGSREVSNAPGWPDPDKTSIASGHSQLFEIDGISNGHTYLPTSSCEVDSYEYGTLSNIGYWKYIQVRHSLSRSPS